MIHRKGCLLKALEHGDISILVHQVNCQGAMASGIAGQIRATFPEHYEDYCNYVVSTGTDDYLLGGVVWTPAMFRGRDGYICGVFGQLNYGKVNSGKRFTNYAGLMKGIVEIIRDSDNQPIGIPKYIGCGLGGGDWNVVEQLLLDIETMYDVQLYCYEK